MSQADQGHDFDDVQRPPLDRPKRKPMRVVPGETSADSSKRKPSTARIVPSPIELKQRFASNLDRLLGIVGLTRRDAAVEIGISYPLLKRLVTAGVSRPDPRNRQSMSRMVNFFRIENVDDLWRTDLISRLLTDEAFVTMFRERMLVVRERRLVEMGPVRREELVFLNRALGFKEPPAAPLIGPSAEKVAAIIASPKGETFQRVIDDYYAMVTPSAPNREGRNRASSA